VNVPSIPVIVAVPLGALSVKKKSGVPMAAVSRRCLENGVLVGSLASALAKTVPLAVTVRPAEFPAAEIVGSGCAVAAVVGVAPGVVDAVGAPVGEFTTVTLVLVLLGTGATPPPPPPQATSEAQSATSGNAKRIGRKNRLLL